MKVTINDVAKHAGVSMKTVSRVINKEPSVRKSTYDIVMRAVDELNYQPNVAARNLAGTSSFTIALVYDNPNAYYVIQMQEGVLSRCRDEGYELVIHPCLDQGTNMAEAFQSMIKRSRLAGLLLTPPLSEQADIIQMVDELGIQYVRIVSGRASDYEDAEHCIFVDDFAASFELTEYLIKQGHRRIAFLCGESEHKSTSERLAGYQEALIQYQIPSDPQLIYEGSYAFESGVIGAQTLLADNNPKEITAILGGNDEVAAGALFAARLMNIEVPNQLSITGFEDSPFSKQTWPKLTTAHQANRMIAEHAARLLFKNIRDHKGSHSDRDIQTIFTPYLVERKSTSPTS